VPAPPTPSTPRDSARDAAERAPGERVAKQTLVIDGFERDDGDLELALQAAEYRLAPHARAREYSARLGVARELRLLATVAARDLRLASLCGRARERTARTLASSTWRALDDELARLTGDSALRGTAARVRALLGALPADDLHALLGQALLNLAPALIQCMPALTHRSAALFARASTSGGAAGVGAAGGASPSPLLTSGGMPDSCFMWRTGGAAARTRLA
jgi:hypothetical protein